MPEMKIHHVVWEMDILAHSARHAAEQALIIQRDEESTALVFDVTPEDGETERVDLME